MRLIDLVSQLQAGRLTDGGDVEVSTATYDSRRAGPGSVFVAVPGLKVDGHDYLEQALTRGAAAIAVQADHEMKWRQLAERRGIPTIVVPDTRIALARIAAAIAGYPARKIGVIGVTGTDGKTSLSHLIEHVLRSAGRPVGLISTAECRIGERPLLDTGRFTTPEAPDLQAMLREIANAGCKWAVVEATSHGLAQHRLDDCEFDIGVVTCIGADHMDFHRTVKAYVAAKGRLFEMLEESVRKGIEKTAVLNLDDPSFAYLKSISKVRTVSYGFSSADISASDIREEGWTTQFAIDAFGARGEIAVPKPGLFNVHNALAASAVCLVAGLDLFEIAAAIEIWPGAPGRMEFINEGQPFTVVVDFAHAPDALSRVLQLLRSHSRGRIIAVLGSIGEREKDRRAAMGRVAAEAADFTIVTDDNPYTEDRDAILRDIATGLTGAGRREGHDFVVLPDRREAVAYAITMAVDDDVVLLAGKGHEREVHLRDSVYECDDRVEARRAIKSLSRT